MAQPATHKKFVFNDMIDGGFLYGLYEDDYGYISEVFGDTLDELEGALMAFAMAYNAGEVVGLKTAAHKMKPLFGFTGLLSVQDAVGNFENLCGKAVKVEGLSTSYESLLEQVNRSKQVLRSEQKRLQQHIEQ